MSRDDIPRLALRSTPSQPTLPLPTRLQRRSRGFPIPIESLVTGMLVGAARVLDGAARAAASGARLAERLADLRAMPPPPRPTWTFRAAAGETVYHEFLVTNERASRLSGAVASTDWYGDGDTETRAAAEVVRFEPPLVDLGPDRMQPVQARVQIPSDFIPGATYRATFFVSGSADLRLPVELQVSAHKEKGRGVRSRPGATSEGRNRR
jgi:hypothetical protein